MDYWSLFVAFMGSDMEKFNANYVRRELKVPQDYIGHAFVWAGSPEGHEFWYEKQKQWRAFVQNPTKLHKLLAGIE
jgi:hypothetical protein